jgi:NADPH-dependent 2,4-dienoyl-CoA reductase/sulfur reductase-like enzyme
MRRDAKLGKRVLVLDEGGNWKGCGTAWHLAEQGHQVTLATPDPIIGKELQRTSADFPLRSKLKKLGAEMLINTCVGQWHGNAATLVDILDMSEQKRPFDSLVLALTNVADTWLADELRGAGIPIVTVGDCVAPRHAPAATYEGRATALAI